MSSARLSGGAAAPASHAHRCQLCGYSYKAQDPKTVAAPKTRTFDRGAALVVL